MLPLRFIKMAGKRKYYDLRYLFMRGLIQRERWQRTRQYLKSAAECTSRAIVSLELADKPIKSVSQAKALEGIGGETLQRLKEIHEKKEKSVDRPCDGKFVSAAGAILVALLELTEQVERSGSDDVALIPEDVLKCEAKSLCEEIFLGEDTGFCQAWWRTEVLVRRGLIKRRQHHKESVYQLMELGRDSAHRLRRDRDAVFPKSKSVKSPRSFTLQQKPEATKLPSQSQESFLYTNDNGSDGIVMEIDTQEMGGDRVGLGEHCKRLEQAGVQYRSCRLPCGDYRWLWRCDGGEMTVPLLIERKRADDIANSLKDGLFWRQVTKMVDWKEEFRQKHIVARLVYVLEGDPGDYVVKCSDGCRGVGRCGNPTLAQVQLAVKDLEEHPELEVRHTSCVEATVQYLAVISQEVQKRASKGDFDMLIVNRFRERNAASTKHNSAEVEVTEIKQDNQTVKCKSQSECTDLEVLEIEDDSQEVYATDGTPSEVPWCSQDSEELPPLDHNPMAVKSSDSNPKNSVCERIPADSKAVIVPVVNDKENDKKMNYRVDSAEEEVDAQFDIDSELAIFSSFSEHAKIKSMFSDTEPQTDCNGSKKFLSSPLKKLKFNCSADYIEIPPQISHVSPCHGKVYLMKRNRKTNQVSKKVHQRLSECSSDKNEFNAGSRDCVELSPRREDVYSSSEPSCSGLESNPHFGVRDESESRKEVYVDAKSTVKMPFNSQVDNPEKQEPSTEVPCEPSSPGTSNSADKEEYSGESILERDVPKQQSDLEDSLPEIDIGEIKELPELPELMPHPVPSTSAAAADTSRPDSEQHGAQEPETAVHSSSKVSNKQRGKSTRGRRKRLMDEEEDIVQSTSRASNKRGRKSTHRKQIIDDDGDNPVVIDLDAEYDPGVPGRGRRKGRSGGRGSSGRRGKTENAVDETLVSKVADILPHCGEQQIKAALIKCQMNMEQTVMHLLDAVPDNGDVVDLT
ncbi:uncharacterized protein LOC124123459 [Haliotis rufescens]|uniref:uncharacterized protein LOC124123459 n=1 Tax=Haliotis rufescens TaxID=6454 RepID=UPI001EAFD79D|nr:uncharacterized protein LOC124123459 [Haliotis rufescens]